MPTPRFESISKSLQGHDTIRPYFEGADENKIDRFAVQAQIIDAGAREFLSNRVLYQFLDAVETKQKLDTGFQAALYETLVDTLYQSPFAAHHESLSDSTADLFKTGKAWDPSPEGIILAGVSTFTEVFSNVYGLLERAYGASFAAHPQHWHLADKIAKLHSYQSTAYAQTYLHFSLNWTKTIDHFEPDVANGSLKFKPGFPESALIPEKVANPATKILSQDDILIKPDTPMTALSDIPIPSIKIGCPITFYPSTLKNLWEVYSTTRERLSPYKSTLED